MSWDNAFSQQMLELAITDEAFVEFHRERSIKQTKVTKEEIQLLTIDEDLTPFERVCHLFRNGQEIQITFALENIGDFLTSLSSRERSVVMTLIKELLISGTSSKTMLTTAGQSVHHSIDTGFLGRDDFVANFFQFAIKSLKSNDKEITESWLLVLVSSFKILLPKDIDQVLSFLKESVSLSQYTSTRKSCCKIVSHLAQVVPENRIKEGLIPKLKALCQDIELDIRSCMCAELEYMVTYTSNDIIEEYIVPELLLLFEDEETVVRRVCFETMTNILPKLRPNFLEQSNIRDHVVKFYESTIAAKKPDDMIIAAQFIGRFFYYLKSILRQGDETFFLEAFTCLCGYGIADSSSSFCIDNKLLSFSSQSIISSASSHSAHHDKFAECRYWCAFNFPAMASMTKKGTFKLHLHPCFVLLIKDSHPLVRKTIALGFHEVAGLISNEVPFLLNSLKTALKDPDLEVVDSILTHLPETLDCFKDEKVSQTYFSELLPTLLTCEQELSKSLRWRTHEKFLRGVSCFHKHISSDQVYYKMVPLVTNILSSNRVRPVKLAAASTLLTFMRYNTNADERNEMCQKIREYAESPNSRMRMLFIDVCYDVVGLFSKAFFKEHFYDSVMLLAVDSEVNVRLKFCKALPLLKSQIKLPSDRLLLQMLEQTVRRIMALETDSEISNTIRNVILELDSTRLSMDGTPSNQDDIIDREREKQEEKVIENSLQTKHEDHGRSMSLCEKHQDKLAPGKRNRKSSSFSGGSTFKEVSKKVPSKGSLTNSAVNSPKKSVSSVKTKDVSSTKSLSANGGSASKLTPRKSSTHTTKRTK